jgi:hypothetical protein
MRRRRYSAQQRHLYLLNLAPHSYAVLAHIADLMLFVLSCKVSFLMCVAGGVGTAYRARLSAVRLLAKPTTDRDEATALSYRLDLNHVRPPWHTK